MHTESASEHKGNKPFLNTSINGVLNTSLDEIIGAAEDMVFNPPFAGRSVPCWKIGHKNHTVKRNPEVVQGLRMSPGRCGIASAVQSGCG